MACCGGVVDGAFSLERAALMICFLLLLFCLQCGLGRWRGALRYLHLPCSSCILSMTLLFFSKNHFSFSPLLLRCLDSSPPRRHARCRTTKRSNIGAVTGTAHHDIARGQAGVHENPRRSRLRVDGVRPQGFEDLRRSTMSRFEATTRQAKRDRGLSIDNLKLPRQSA